MENLSKSFVCKCFGWVVCMCFIVLFGLKVFVHLLPLGNNMNHYLHIYKTLLKINLVALLTYRGNFVSSVFSSILWATFGLFLISLLTLRVPMVYGWNREELFMLMLGYNIIVGVFHSLFSRNFERFSQIIHYGELDTLLLKPIDSQFLLSFWLFNYASLSRIVIGIVGFTLFFVKRNYF